ncbi:cyclic nucleotide-binding/CBS domain-containing protein [Candidatus Nanosalina sp. VS9-1]|uniref:CBS domain-containing protein n=1 Tax=Candidatus Nanosalina sp. VS9-1 TaxID=3388566 RepID=UPI0039DFF427
MSKTARDLMDEPDFIEHDASVKDVEKEFDSSENTLIVKHNGEAVGEIHENSLLKALIPEEKIDEESLIGILGLSFDQSYAPETAEDLMNEHEVTVPPEETLGELAFLMDREDVRSLPVKEDGEIIGVVHEDAVVREGEV